MTFAAPWSADIDADQDAGLFAGARDLPLRRRRPGRWRLGAVVLGLSGALLLGACSDDSTDETSGESSATESSDDSADDAPEMPGAGSGDLPEGFPAEDVPLPADAMLAHATEEGQGWRLTYVVDAEDSEVLDRYQGSLQDAGFSTETGTTPGSGLDGVSDDWTVEVVRQSSALGLYVVPTA